MRGLGFYGILGEECGWVTPARLRPSCCFTEKTACTQAVVGCGSSAEATLKLLLLSGWRPRLRAQGSFSRVPAANLTVLKVKVVLNT